MNPFAAVRKLIEDSQSAHEGPLRADALLCPGDLAHRINVDGLKYAWSEVSEIARLLGTDRVIATAGNHDVVRHERLPAGAPDDAWVASLKALSPHFPSGQEQESSRYFLDDFVLTEGEHWRVVSLNSCANLSEEGQFWHGMIEEKTLEHIARKMNGSRKDINILMCHHHPMQWSHLRSADTSFMQGGDRLIQALEQDDPSRWILLHGHRHMPALGYAGDSSSGPVRLSAGSLGVCLTKEGRHDARNQFYMLEFDLEEIKRLGLVGAGRFRAWDWNVEGGMTLAEQSAELPGSGGFGFRRQANDLARRAERLARKNGRSVTWDELLGSDARWAYIAPRDLSMLRRTLEMKGALVQPDDGRANIDRISLAP